MLSVQNIQTLGLKLTPQQSSEVVEAFKVAADKYKINTPLRFKHFMGQCLHETGGLTILSERGGSAYCEKKYGYQTSTGKNLGNTAPGDGYKFRGRGLIQLTGKSNYAAASKGLYGDNRLLTNPDLVITSMYNAVIVAAWWWYNCNRKTAFPDGQPNFYADKDDTLSISKTVNGGPASVNKKYTPNGMPDRIRWTDKLATIVKNSAAVITSKPVFKWFFGAAAAAGFFF